MKREDQRPLRFRCDIAGQLHWNGGVHAVRIIDLSETGVFVETDLDLQVGEHADLELALPGGEAWRASLVATRLANAQREIQHPRLNYLTVSRPGAGFSFVAVPDEEMERLRTYLEVLDQS